MEEDAAEYLSTLYTKAVLNAILKQSLDSVYQQSIRRARRAHWLAAYFVFYTGETALRESESVGYLTRYFATRI